MYIGCKFCDSLVQLIRKFTCGMTQYRQCSIAVIWEYKERMVQSWKCAGVLQNCLKPNFLPYCRHGRRFAQVICHIASVLHIVSSFQPTQTHRKLLNRHFHFCFSLRFSYEKLKCSFGWGQRVDRVDEMDAHNTYLSEKLPFPSLYILHISWMFIFLTFDFYSSLPIEFPLKNFSIRE